MATRKLGRGLDFLISGQDEGGGEAVLQIALASVQPNPYQPRKEFRPEDLADLAASIREHGILQPIVVRRQGDGYEIVAGERRFRASENLGLPTIPAIVRDATDADMLELALTENIQRADLNPLELARAYESYIHRFQLTQEQAAERLGKSRSSIANTMRLLELPADVQEMISRGSLSMGHARALLSLDTPQAQRELAGRVAVEGLSVRDVERVGQEQKAQASPEPASKTNHIEDLEKQLRERLGTRVSVQDKAGRGRIVIEYFSNEELTRLLDILLTEPSDL